MPESFFFLRAWPIIRAGQRRRLRPEDLPEIERGFEAADATTALERAYLAITARSRHRRIALLRAMLGVFGAPFYVGVALSVLANACKMCAPLVLRALLECMATDRVSAALVALALAAILATYTITLGSFFYRASALGMQASTALSGMVYRKALRLAAAARRDYPHGRVVALALGDAHRVEAMLWCVADIFTVPLHVALTAALLLRLIGRDAAVGMALLLLTMPLMSRVSSKAAWHTKRRTAQTDARVAMLTDTAAGIRAVKLYGWDATFGARLAAVRAEELRLLGKVRVWGVVSDVSLSVGVVMAIMATFGTALARGQTFPASTIFAAMGIFGAMAFPVRSVPLAVARTLDGMQSLGRIKAFLDAPEVAAGTALGASVSRASITRAHPPRGDTWPLDEKTHVSTVVRDADPSMSGRFSTLDEMTRGPTVVRDADPSISGRVSTLDEKTFGPTVLLPEDLQSVHSTVPAAESRDVGVTLDDASFSWGAGTALAHVSLRIPPGALVAVVGPVGAGKSSLLAALLGEMLPVGGVVARSRSVAYCAQLAWLMRGTVRENIVFGADFDAARLAAVVEACALTRDLAILPGGDTAEVGERGCALSGGQRQRVSLARAAYRMANLVLLDDVLSALDATVGAHVFRHCVLGLMAGRTRILVTHRHDLLPETDLVVVMEGGRIAHVGTHAELVARNVRFSATPAPPETDALPPLEVPEEPTDAPLSPSCAGAPVSKAPVALDAGEEESSGAFSAAVAAAYVRSAGGHAVALAPLLAVLVQNAARVAADRLFASEAQGGPGAMPRAACLALYAALGVVQVAAAAASAAGIAAATLRAARSLYAAAFAGLLRAKMAFYDATPVGRIVARMTKDADVIDTRVFEALGMLVPALGTITATLATLLVFSPAVAPLVALAVAALAWLQAVYRPASRAIRVAEARVRAPYLAQLAESLAGLATIRAYGRARAFVRRNAALRDVLTRATHADALARRWLVLRCELAVEALILGVALTAVALRVEPRTAGQFLNYMLTLMSPANLLMRQLAELEGHAVSTERMAHYACALPVEGARTAPLDAKLEEWPSRGEVVFDAVSVRYTPSLPLVLDKVSFAVQAGQKVGVVGRTGAGKSSLTLALFRMVEAERGAITVDGVDIRNVGLDRLRTALAIIPQESVLFDASVRFNIDPFGTLSDAALYAALDKAHLRECVSALGGLDATVAEDSFSAGQKQLFCLARALVRQPRVLVLDEATANVDPDTDALVQDAIRTHFAHATVITIAHRISTIMDYDRVLVLDAGRVVEFDAPSVLSAKKNGFFAELARESRSQH